MRTAEKETDGSPTRYLTPGVQAQLAELIFRGNDWLAPVATWICALLLAVVSFTNMRHGVLGAWFAVVTLNSLGMAVANYLPSLHRRVDRGGTPLTANFFAMTGGLCFGTFLWIDAASLADTELRLTVFCILLAISAGAVGGIAGIAGHGRYVLYPIWVSGSLALLYHGEVLLAAGAVFFVLVMAKDLAATNNLLAEILYHRELADGRANTAQNEALRDPLTNLLNRAGLTAATEVDTFGTTSPVTAMFVDLDHFKMVNDRFGHATGDQVLIEVADRLTSTVRPQDIIARLGGDEFLILIDAPLAEASRDGIARSIITALELPFVTEQFEARISASIGITVVLPGAFDLDAVQREADHALYVAKAQGRRRSAHFDETSRSDLEERSALEAELRRAVDTGGIDAWGQPIVDLETGEVAVVELLARWQRSDGSFYPPGRFIPLAEEAGLIDQLSKQMLDRAVETLHSWRSHPTMGAVSISVNVSPRQLANRRFTERVCFLMTSGTIPEGRLILELTESADLDDVRGIDSILTELVESGVRLALDDFGSGHTSMQHLLGLPIEYVKLDGTLIKDLGQDPRQTALVRSIRDLAGTIGKQVVVEGVETEAQVAKLRELRLHLAQGYHFGRAQPLSLFTSDTTAPA